MNDTPHIPRWPSTFTIRIPEGEPSPRWRNRCPVRGPRRRWRPWAHRCTRPAGHKDFHWIAGGPWWLATWTRPISDPGEVDRYEWMNKPPRPCSGFRVTATHDERDA